MLDPDHPLANLLKEDQRYTLDAYVFVFDALGFAQNVLEMGTEHESEPSADPPPDEQESAPERHVSGQELCEAIRRFALEQFGLMAQTVLGSWGIRSTADFGEIVFNLIGIGQMRKTPQDCREDFVEVYDFDTALTEGFEITMPE